MSQTKAQLVAPVGVVTATAMNVSGVLTATTFDGSFTGAASSIAQGNNLNVGVVTASGIAGDITGSATSITQGTNVTFGSLTASRLVGNLTGDAVGNALGDALSATVSGITTSNNISAGVVTSTDFRGDGTNISGVPSSPVTAQTIGTTYSIDVTASGSSNYTLSGTDRNGAVSGSDPTVTVEVGDTLNFVVDASGHPFYIRVSDGGANVSTPAATNQGAQSGTVSWTPNTAGTYYYQCGNHPGMLGTITVTATTTIDLSKGNNILFNQTANTTISFANTSTTEAISILRKDGTGTITWPSSIKWNGSSPPILASSDQSNDWNLIKLLTRDSGLTWRGWEEAKNEGTFNAFVWGGNYYGGLGLNEALPGAYKSSPTQLPGVTWAKGMAGGSGGFFYGSGAIKTDGTLWAMGFNYQGGLGLNDTTEYSSPTQVGTDTTWDQVITTWKAKAAIKTDGTMWAWGSDVYGALAQNNNVKYSSPVQIPGTWSERVDGFSTYGIKTNGTLWSWGGQYKGSFGRNTGNITYVSSPAQIGADTTWATVTALVYGGAAVKTDGTLWTWGSGSDTNFRGALGQNNLSNYSSPTQVGTDTTWGKTNATHSSIINYAMFNIKTNGTLWSWGENMNGVLGHNEHPSSSVGGTDYSSPTQVGTSSDWSKLAGSGYHMNVLKTDGTLWVLGGWRGGGELGLNTISPNRISSPTQLPGIWDVMDNNVIMGGSGTMMRKLTN